jgi:hypothetical protein
MKYRHCDFDAHRQLNTANETWVGVHADLLSSLIATASKYINILPIIELDLLY